MPRAYLVPAPLMQALMDWVEAHERDRYDAKGVIEQARCEEKLFCWAKDWRGDNDVWPDVWP